MLKEYAYAKINLALEVMDVKDGYHMVNNLMVPISLYDELIFEKSDKIELINNEFSDNIIIKAAKLFFEYTKINKGVKITLNKNIPSAAGLAGGSSDAAATLRGLNRLFEANLTKNELIDLSAKLGSDVGFFILNKPALCTGRGEIVNPINSGLSKIDLLLLKVDSGLSTKEVYKNYEWDKVSKNIQIDNLIKGINNNDINLIRNNIFNDLKNTSLSLNNEMNDLYQLLKNNGLNPYVSGSGPTIYLFNPTKEEINKAKSLVNNIFNYECHILSNDEINSYITEIGNPRCPSGYLGEEMLDRMNDSHSDLTNWGLSFVDFKKTDIVLDIGCGGGKTINTIANLADMVYGIDYSEISVSKSIKLNKEYIDSGKVNVLLANVEKMPFKDKAFDKIITVESFYFWPDHLNNLKEVKRILKDDGKFILIADLYDNGNLNEKEKKAVSQYNLFNPTIDVFKDIFDKAGFNIDIYLKENTKYITIIGNKK